VRGAERLAEEQHRERAPKNGALANTLCARVAPSACDAVIRSAMLAP
jgi:hypothetical protein